MWNSLKTANVDDDGEYLVNVDVNASQLHAHANGNAELIQLPLSEHGDDVRHHENGNARVRLPNDYVRERDDLGILPLKLKARSLLLNTALVI
jgi:hypothetical protein